MKNLEKRVQKRVFRVNVWYLKNMGVFLFTRNDV